MKSSESLNELATALSKAQSVMKHAHKTSDNPFFKSTYADLAECIDASRQPMADNGLSIVQGPSIGEAGQVCLTTRLLHASGQWIETDAYATPKDLGPQSVGSAVTYLRRYSLSAMLGLASEDDDGNASSQPPQKPKMAVKRDEKIASLDATSKKKAAEAKPADPHWGEAEKPEDAISVVATALSYIANMTSINQAARVREQADKRHEEGKLSVKERGDIEDALIKKLAELGGLKTGNQVSAA